MIDKTADALVKSKQKQQIMLVVIIFFIATLPHTGS